MLPLNGPLENRFKVIFWKYDIFLTTSVCAPKLSFHQKHTPKATKKRGFHHGIYVNFFWVIEFFLSSSIQKVDSHRFRYFWGVNDLGPYCYGISWYISCNIFWSTSWKLSMFPRNAPLENLSEVIFWKYDIFLTSSAEAPKMHYIKKTLQK